MPVHRDTTVGEALKDRTGGGAQLIVDPSVGVFRPARWEFADMGDLAGYLRETFGAKPTAEGGVRGSMSRKGQYVRRRSDGARAFTFGDPILDQVTSPLGEIVIGGRTMDLTRPDGPLAHGGDTGAIGPRLPTAPGGGLVLTADDGGVERWASEDGTTIEFRTGSSSMTFRAWKKHKWYGYWSMGAEVTTRGSEFEAANINSRYYDTAYAQVCAVIYDSDSDRDDSYLDEYEWGWNSPQPHRVESLCRAQWCEERFAGVVAVGDECFALDVEPWPSGWPSDWPPVSGAEVRPAKLSMFLRSIGLVGRATATVVNHNPISMGVTVSDAEGTLFTNPSGTFTIPGNGTMSIPVTFDAARTGVFTSRLRILAGGQSFVVPITATVTQVGQPL